MAARRCCGSRIPTANAPRQEAIDAIIGGLDWLGLDYDEPPVFQSDRAGRHAEVAQSLLDGGHAYKCFATAEELEAMRAEQRANKQPMRYDGRWRDRDAADMAAETPYTVRLRTPADGSVTIEDAVQGSVTVDNGELDDYVILRADGTPTYMLAAVVDDRDMGCTHVIRGDDHLNNAFRQIPIYRAMDAIEGGWPIPTYAHIPLIHGSDGAKLSKRHGALGVEAYRDELGILSDALFNYLLRLGWAHGDREELSRAEAISLFDLAGVGKSPSRFDMKKLDNLNGHYLREADEAALVELIAPRVSDDIDRDKLVAAMPVLKVRAKNLNDLAESTAFLSTESAPVVYRQGAGIADRSEPPAAGADIRTIGGRKELDNRRSGSQSETDGRRAGIGAGEIGTAVARGVDGNDQLPRYFRRARTDRT